MAKYKSRIDYYAPHWRELRSRVLKETGGKCERCGKSYRKIHMHLHHKHYRTIGNEAREDVELLCVYCHAIEHGRRPPKKNKKPRIRKRPKHKFGSLWRPWLRDDRERMRRLGVPIPRRYRDLD